jgi:hypothetical protein
LGDGVAQRGAHRRGANGGDAQTESDEEEGLQWWETGEVDAWAVDERCTGEKKIQPAGGGSVLKRSGGEGAGGVGAAWRQSGGALEGALAQRR